MALFRQILWVFGCAIAAAALTYGFKGPPNRRLFCDVATLKSDELCLSQISASENVLWVDARSRKDWQADGLEGSILWNLDPAEDMLAFEAAAAERIAAASRVVVYCGDENCGISRQVAGRIRNMDLGPGVFVLRGGWRALREAGRVK